MRRSSAGRLVAGSAAVLFLVGAVTAGAVQLLRMQARAARRAIGKPFGEAAPEADKLFKKKYGDPLHLLLLGDSIAAGLGAGKPKHTLGAQLARRLARETQRAVRLHTAALVGSETSMLRTQLGGLPQGYRADVAVIVVGGNDVTHRVRPGESVRHLCEAVEALRAAGTEVVVGTCPDLGALTALAQPLRALAGRSSRQLAGAQREAVLGLGARVVSLGDVVGPFFVSRPEEMFAVDRFHPSSAGYKRTAKAMLPSLLVAVGHERKLPGGHEAPQA